MKFKLYKSSSRKLKLGNWIHLAGALLVMVKMIFIDFRRSRINAKKDKKDKVGKKDNS